jgi:hypothetical protein
MKKTKDCLKDYEIIDPLCTYDKALKLLQEDQFNRLTFDYWGGKDDRIHSLTSLLVLGDKECECMVVVEKKEKE